MIELKDVTLKYSSTKGIFNLNFNVEKGEALGYVGPNDAGKTTTIRMLMGLIRAGRGSATIDGLNCFSRAASIQKNLGYVPEDVVLLKICGSKNTSILSLRCEEYSAKKIVSSGIR